MNEMLDFAAARRNMVDCQLRTWDVMDPAVIAAFDDVPRERFVPEAQAAIAYFDRGIPVGRADGETRVTLTPAVLARLVQAADIQPRDRALDIACGLGLSTAVLARLAAEVVGVEASASMAQEAQSRLVSAGVPNATVVAGDLASGAAAAGMFDVILINGAVSTRPEGLLSRLAEGGRLASIVGHGRSGRAMLYTRTGTGIAERTLFDAAAEPLAAFREAPSFVF